MTPKELADGLHRIEYSATLHLHGSNLMKLAKALRRVRLLRRRNSAD